MIYGKASAQYMSRLNRALAQIVLILCYLLFVCYWGYTLSFRKLIPFLTVQVIPKLRWFGAARDSEMATLLFLFFLIAISSRFISL